MSDVLVEGRGGSGGFGMLPPDLQAGYSELRKLPLFDGIPNEDLSTAILTGGIEKRVVRRDTFVADPSSVATGDAPIIFVVEGQVVAAVFDSAELNARRAEQDRFDTMTAEEREQLSLLPPPPLARIAKKNVALFRPGELFNAAALSTSGGAPVAFYAASPAVLAALTHAAVADLATRYPFFEVRLRRAVQMSRDRLRSITGVKQEMLDFFIRHGLSVSGEMVRVRQLDRCIDCKLCEEACEERYGAKRLTLGGYQLGMLDFIYTCRTCTDQRCLDPCEYDSIKFDAEIGEVVINDASCTGCTLCAQACPYDAIEMVDIEDPESPTYREGFKLRLELDGSLKFGSGTPRIARARRIANKCDHCLNYSDQACVSACPTGSLIEVSAYDLFRERSPLEIAAASAGYSQEIAPDRKEQLPVKPFTRGVGVRDGGKARVRRGRMGPVILWGIGLAAWMLALVEILLRDYSPTNSIQYFMFREAGLNLGMAETRVIYHPGTELAVWCGYIGTSLLAVSAIYPMMRRARVFRFIASNTMWFDFHMMAGVIGPMFIILHSDLKLDNWVSAAFWSMIIVVISGVVGRYLYTQVPDLMNGRELEELDHSRAFARLRREHPLAAAEADAELEAHRLSSETVAKTAGMMGALWWIVMEDFRRPIRWVQRRRRLRATNVPRAIWKELVVRSGRRMLIDRRRVLAPRAQLLLHSWKKVHVPFTIVLVIISAFHIWVAFKFSM